MSAALGTEKPGKGHKGLGMEGAIARWYARNTWKGIEEYRKLARSLASQLEAGSNVLEVAPGPGYLAIERAKLGRFQLAGLDISKTFVAMAAANAKDAGVPVEFHRGFYHPERRGPLIKRLRPDVSPSRPAAEGRRPWDSKGTKTSGRW